MKLARKPKYARSFRTNAPKKDGFDKYSVILRPVATEKAMKKMEEENTMVIIFNKVFICGLSASKN